jgi:5-methylcytosine-specific restriction endonuclease McrA
MCKKDLPTDQFGFDGSRKNYCKSRCKTCEPIYQREYRARNAEKKKAYDKEHYQNNRERILEGRSEYREWNRELLSQKSSEYFADNKERHAYHRKLRRARLAEVLRIPFTDQELAQKMSMWGNKCYLCGGPYEEEDHVKPLCKGGPEILANLRPICKSCNCSKGGKWPYYRLQTGGE